MFGRHVAEFLGMGDLGGDGLGRSNFTASYSCFPVSFVGRDDMEKGNKILLPQSALHALARLHISWPMLFEVTNEAKGRRTHSGVLEFTADEGTCLMPYWMMINLLLEEGDVVRITNISLPKGTFVQLQPLTVEFLEVSNPRAVLEVALRGYAALTVGDLIHLPFMEKTFQLLVTDLRPANAVSIIETDVEVEFKPPEGYAEAAARDAAAAAAKEAASAREEEAAATADAELPRTAEKKTVLFSGKGCRLDGKAIRPSSSNGGGPVEATEHENNEPWRNKLPNGVKTYCAEYEQLKRSGRIPGIVGKVRRGVGGGGASGSGSGRSIGQQAGGGDNDNDHHHKDGAGSSTFTAFQGKGNSLLRQ